MNPYAIILILFTLAGLAMMAWGWIIIARAKKTARWPSVEGSVEPSPASSEDDGTLRHVVISYTVAGQRYLHNLDFSKEPSMIPDASVADIDKYPVGAKVRVHYNLEMPGQATVTPGLANDDWLIFAMGLAAAVMGIAFLLFSG